eukprot:scaffold8130_cov168-Skeletonema_dohrnii-CCMP3373.AAC.1
MVRIMINRLVGSIEGYVSTKSGSLPIPIPAHSSVSGVGVELGEFPQGIKSSNFEGEEQVN